MYAGGERATQRLFRFGHKLAGSGGENAIYLAGQTIRGVALGVVVTAIAQSLFGGIGLIIAGVPLAGALTGAMLLFVDRADRSESCSRYGCSVALLDR
jgi:predicted PurR-regulated permease PerM